MTDTTASKTWEPGPMMRRLAAGEQPYGTGPWDSDHVELFQRDAAALIAEFDRLRAVEAAAAKYVHAGLCGNHSLPGGLGREARADDYAALVAAVRTNPDFRG